ncbi:helix-turn-helix transcriptional regulator [Nostoc ellipsosporum NOK]|nr:helix-turn-helix transcriptional regulator [Nostoc ellipsosporum NOK]
MGKERKITRSEEITVQYFAFLDKHISDLLSGHATKMMELKEIASALFVSQKHLSQTIQFTQGQHPCHFYDQKIIAAAKKLLAETDLSAADIAEQLTYDPSNFSKFFKKYTGKTPGQFRNTIKK